MAHPRAADVCSGQRILSGARFFRSVALVDAKGSGVGGLDWIGLDWIGGGADGAFGHAERSVIDGDLWDWLTGLALAKDHRYGSYRLPSEPDPG